MVTLSAIAAEKLSGTSNYHTLHSNSVRTLALCLQGPSCGCYLHHAEWIPRGDRMFQFNRIHLLYLIILGLSTPTQAQNYFSAQPVNTACVLRTCPSGQNRVNTGRRDANGCEITTCEAPMQVFQNQSACLIPSCPEQRAPVRTARLTPQGCPIYECPAPLRQLSTGPQCMIPLCSNGATPISPAAGGCPVCPPPPTVAPRSPTLAPAALNAPTKPCPLAGYTRNLQGICSPAQRR